MRSFHEILGREVSDDEQQPAASKAKVATTGKAVKAKKEARPKKAKVTATAKKEKAKKKEQPKKLMKMKKAEATEVKKAAGAAGAKEEAKESNDTIKTTIDLSSSSTEESLRAKLAAAEAENTAIKAKLTRAEGEAAETAEIAETAFNQKKKR